MNTPPDAAPATREPAAILSELAYHREKQQELADDAYFREAWADLVDVLDDPLDAARRTALLSFKPDILPARKIPRVLDICQASGFEVVTSWTFQHNRHSMRELWRYNWHIYPPDRLSMCTLLHGVAPTLVLLLREARADRRVPASVRLTNLKGSADPAWRRPGQIRTEIEPPNAVINHVHVADEPIDVIREVGIFADRAQRRQAFTCLAHPSSSVSGLAETIERLEARVPRLDFNVDATVPVCSQYWSWTPETQRTVMDAVRGECTLTFDQLCEFMPGKLDGRHIWDFLLLASVTLQTERPGGAPSDLLPAGSVADWEQRHGK